MSDAEPIEEHARVHRLLDNKDLFQRADKWAFDIAFRPIGEFRKHSKTNKHDNAAVYSAAYVAAYRELESITVNEVWCATTPLQAKIQQLEQQNQVLKKQLELCKEQRNKTLPFVIADYDSAPKEIEKLDAEIAAILEVK